MDAYKTFQMRKQNDVTLEDRERYLKFYDEGMIKAL